MLRNSTARRWRVPSSKFLIYGYRGVGEYLELIHEHHALLQGPVWILILKYYIINEASSGSRCTKSKIRGQTFDSHPIYTTSKMCMRDSSHRRTEADLHGFVYPFTGFEGGCDTLEGNDTLEGKDGF